jgi:hypothetical protein
VLAPSAAAHQEAVVRKWLLQQCLHQISGQDETTTRCKRRVEVQGILQQGTHKGDIRRAQRSKSASASSLHPQGCANSLSCAEVFHFKAQMYRLPRRHSTSHTCSSGMCDLLLRFLMGAVHLLPVPSHM